MENVGLAEVQEQELDSQLEPEEVEDGLVSVERPRIQPAPTDLTIEARVVYLGNNRNMSVRFNGGILVEENEAGQDVYLPTFGDVESTMYDFSRFDTRGRPNMARMTKDGKVWHLCRHIGHLVRFMQVLDTDRSPVFEVRCRRVDRDRLERFAREAESRRNRTEEQGESVLRAMNLL